jgi:phosphatidate cytidylyltransferase
MLIQRVITATIGIPLVVLAIFAGGVVFAAVVAVAVLVAMLELAAGRDLLRSPEALIMAVAAATLPLAAAKNTEWLLGAVAGVTLVSTALLARTPAPERGVSLWQWTTACALYVGILASHYVLLRDQPNGRDWLFFAVITVWVADTGAYFVGRAIGRHKLAPAISPGKTIEGCIGALFTGLAAVFVLDRAFDLDLELGHRIALGLIIPVVAIIGDLAESSIKRSMGVKDSSGLFPGHGGVLDRMDSLLFAIPVVYYYLRLVVS